MYILLEKNSFRDRWDAKGVSFSGAATISASNQNSVANISVNTDGMRNANEHSNASSNTVRERDYKPVRSLCFNCVSLSHEKSQCNAIKQPSKNVEKPALVHNLERYFSRNKFIAPHFIGDSQRPYVSYRDTGSHLTLVNINLVDETCYTGESIEIQRVQSKELQ
jgi:hypothetical protein